MPKLLIYSNPDHFKQALQRHPSLSWFSNGEIHGLAEKPVKEQLMQPYKAPDVDVVNEVRKQLEMYCSLIENKEI